LAGAMRNLLLADGFGFESRACQIVSIATILVRRDPTSTGWITNLATAVSGAAGAQRARQTAADTTPASSARLDLLRFVPFRLNRLAAEVSAALSAEYQLRYGLDIPEWRVLATLGFRRDVCSAQFISDCTRTHKSTISRAVTALMRRRLVERVENADDRREFRLRMTRKGRALYEELFPRLLRKEQDMLSCLSAQERKEFARLLGKIEHSLDLVQTSAEADAKEAY
jgi:DNA-binding MarR family transcriptional regulator